MGEGKLDSKKLGLLCSAMAAGGSVLLVGVISKHHDHSTSNRTRAATWRTVAAAVGVDVDGSARRRRSGRFVCGNEGKRWECVFVKVIEKTSEGFAFVTTSTLEVFVRELVKAGDDVSLVLWIGGVCV